jgi:glycosyltransferase involved in cell wall biosynthesis
MPAAPTDSLPMPSPPFAPADAAAPADRHIRVFMLDLASIVPYYTGHLAAALAARQDVSVRLGVISYHLDPGYFERQGFAPRPGLADLVSRIRIRSARLRHGLKSIEYCANWLATTVRARLERPDIVHVQFLPLLTTGLGFEMWMLRALRRSGARIVYTVHNVLPQDTGERHRARYAAVYGMVDHLVCHDQDARNRLVNEFGLAPGRISVIPHGVLFGPAGAEMRASASGVRARLGLPDDGAVVLCQGIIRPYKGIDFLLDAWRQVHQSGATSAVLVICGTGDQALLDDIRARVKRLGLEGTVRLDLRFVSAEELAAYYAAADILVYPYREITTSGALMTGIGKGKPIVATRLAAFEKLIVHGENGWLFEKDDAAGLAGALADLIRNPSLRERLGRASSPDRAAEAGLEWPAIAAGHQAAYAAALGAGSR